MLPSGTRPDEMPPLFDDVISANHHPPHCCDFSIVPETVAFVPPRSDGTQMVMCTRKVQHLLCPLPLFHLCPGLDCFWQHPGTTSHQIAPTLQKMTLCPWSRTSDDPQCPFRFGSRQWQRFCVSHCFFSCPRCLLDSLE